jgi:hypothetical protein
MANLNINVTDGNNLTVAVTPVPSQTIQINRGVAGPAGPAGPNSIAGYPINCNSLILHDVLMFGVNEWVNTNQTEITDGGNF